MFQEIDRLISENKYSGHSFIKHLQEGKIKRENIKNWAIQKYFQVYYQTSGFSAIHANCIYEDVRQFEVEQLIEEETGLKGGLTSHYDMMKRFAVALGASEEEFTKAIVGQSVIDHVSRLKKICSEEHFVYGLLSFYIFESQTPESAMIMYNIFKRDFKFCDSTLEWFLVHGEADVEHSHKSKSLIMKYAPEVKDFENRKIDFVMDGVMAWRKLQDYYYGILVR